MACFQQRSVLAQRCTVSLVVSQSAHDQMNQGMGPYASRIEERGQPEKSTRTFTLLSILLYHHSAIRVIGQRQPADKWALWSAFGSVLDGCFRSCIIHVSHISLGLMLSQLPFSALIPVTLRGCGNIDTRDSCWFSTNYTAVVVHDISLRITRA